jgi:hypothetical protein
VRSRGTVREMWLGRMRMRVQVCVLALRWMLRWVWKRVRVEMWLLRRRRMRMRAKVEAWVLMRVRVWAKMQVRVQVQVQTRVQVWVLAWVRVQALVQWWVAVWVVGGSVSSRSVRIRSDRRLPALCNCRGHIVRPLSEVAGSLPAAKTCWPSTSGPPSSESLPGMGTESQSSVVSRAMPYCYVESMPEDQWLGRSTPHIPHCDMGHTRG